jgi:ABC-2 type transport system permease protein
MRRHAELLGQYLLQYTKMRLAYRWDFFLSLVTMTLATVFGVLVVFLMFRPIERLLGWSFWEIVFLYGFSLLPMSLFNTISINLYYFPENYIVQGKFDRVLLRPVNSLFQILFEQFRLEALGDFLLGLFLLAFCAHRLGLKLGVLDASWLALATLCGATIYTSVFIMLTSVSFFMEDRVGVMPPVYNMITFGRYPMDIYNGFIRFVLTWVLPFGFASFYPTAGVLRGDAYRLYSWLLPLVTAAFLALAVLIWQRGTRNYSSTGS